MDSAALRELDLYSSSEYVRHSNGTGREVGNGICYENVAVYPAALTCSSPSSVYHHGNNGGCSLETLFLPPGRCPAPLSPCPSRTSCPPVQRPLRRLLHQHKQWPAASLCKSPQQFSFIIDPLAAKEMPRMRTKSLDNGLKVSLGAAIRRRKDRICEGTPMGGPAGDGTGSRKSAFCEGELSPAGAESPLETAKNFLRRFYNQSTLRLTGRRRRRGTDAKKGDDQRTEQSLYSSAMGPFFEMRKPQPEEMPFLPYNIHYTIESTDEASDGSGEEDNAVPRPLRPGSPQSEWSCTPTCSSATITISPNAVTNSLILSPATTANRPTAVDGLFEAYPHQQQHHHRSVLASKDVPMAPSLPTSPASPQHFPQQSESLLAETVATTPSVGYGSLKSSSDSEGRRDSDKTRRMGPAEKRFADWNDLFQYLRREI
uniref:Ras and Rab interactor 2 n=1 Tax=Globodera pallida TaxID=36090 RepID=A0A183CPY0_GLOPA